MSKPKYKVYLITNIINGKKYVGQTRGELASRFRGHTWAASKCIKLANAIKKYGKENFRIELLELCDSAYLMAEREVYWINEMNTIRDGYNLIAVLDHRADCSEETRERKRLINLGKKATPETRAKIGAASKGRKPSPETTAKIVEKLTGSKRTPEQRTRMSEAAKKRGVAPEVIEKMILANRGRKQSPEEIERRAAANRGKKRSPEAVKKSAEGRRGKKWSDEARQRVSEQRKGIPLSSEHLENVRAAAKRRIGIPTSPEATAKRVASRLANKKRKEQNNALESEFSN